MHNPLIVALDVSGREQAIRLVEKLAPVVGLFKIGSELFTSEGPSIVKEVLSSGSNVFLDLNTMISCHCVQVYCSGNAAASVCYHPQAEAVNDERG